MPGIVRLVCDRKGTLADLEQTLRDNGFRYVSGSKYPAEVGHQLVYTNGPYRAYLRKIAEGRPHERLDEQITPSMRRIGRHATPDTYELCMPRVTVR